jgi:hypothetical protein
MHDALTTYFQGEKNAGLLIAGIGVGVLALAAVFYQPRWELRSFAMTLAVFALIEIAIGVGLYLRTGPQVASLVAQLGTDSMRFFADEGAQMARVQRNFVVIQYIELVVIVTAAIAAISFRNRFALAGIALVSSVTPHSCWRLISSPSVGARFTCRRSAREAQRSRTRPAPARPTARQRAPDPSETIRRSRRRQLRPRAESRCGRQRC